MSVTKITQYIHRPNKTELGMASTHETYMYVGSDIDMSGIFPIGKEVEVEDQKNGRSYKLKSSGGGEFRINQMGSIYRDYNVMPGDEIVITQYDTDGAIKNSFTVNNYNRVELVVNSKGTEINNLDRLEKYKQKDNTYSLEVLQGTTVKVLDISFLMSKKKREDSPWETDYYKVLIGGKPIDNGNYYISLNDVNVLTPKPKKSEFNVVLLYDDLPKATVIKKIDTAGNMPTQKIYYGTPGSGKSHNVEGIVKGLYSDEEIEEYVFRTTFHPDSDYASFVGCYKPQMDGKDIKYEFTPQAFTNAYVKAWQKPDKQIYLIIEEINRGNCAQIFGDLFQLLDRKDGVSEYPINADADLRQYLKKEEVLGENSEGIANGKLKLPANLNILATMNTSDQSLFPMDSAFKRRWSWECVPIDYENAVSSKFMIKINGERYNWHTFLGKVNERIKSVTQSEDKQMGNFFINSNIDERQFIDKVMFYLWNDICKEEYKTTNNFFRNYTNDAKTEDVEFTFNDLFDKTKNGDNKLLVGFMDYIGVEAE